ncbi:hypothetical protein HYV84_00055 [Candidatus Woesearchaeota archaeon]|nr:hypothetical protein [Candidatus Woesearchaeota archaeon]
MKPNRLFVQLFFLLLLPLTFSITLDDLLNSYDFSFNAPQVNVSDIKVFGNDSDNDGTLDQLIINISTEVEGGNYSFTGDLYRQGRWITTITEFEKLLAGANTVLLTYHPTLLQNGTYNLTLTMQESFLTLFKKDNIFSFEYDNALFEKPAIEINISGFSLVSNDSDQEAEFLTINATLNVTAPGDYRLTALIKDNASSLSDEENKTLQTGITNVTFSFSANDLQRLRIENPTLYGMIAQNGFQYFFDFNVSIPLDLDDLDATTNHFGDTFKDGLVGPQGGNESEFLEINFSVDIEDAGDYIISLELADTFGTFVTIEKQSFNIPGGIQPIQYRINGTAIYLSGINGPYLIHQLTLMKGNTTEDSFTDIHTTAPYNFADFAKPSLPDLLISGTANNESAVQITVKNNGSAAALPFTITALDSNFSQISQGIADFLGPSETKDISLAVNFSNHSKVFLALDLDNSVEESSETNNIRLLGLTDGKITFSITLPAGWNLLSFPLDGDNKSISNLLSQSNSSIALSFNSTSDDWLFFRNETSNTFASLGFPQGFWVKPKSPITISFTGINHTYPIMFPLLKGWNLISYPSLQEINASRAIAEVNDSITMLFSYQNSSWLTYNTLRDPSLNTLTSLTPGLGYWLFAKNDVNFTFDGVFR